MVRQQYPSVFHRQAASDTCNRLPMSVAILLLSRCLRHCREILEQHAMHEDVPTANFAKKDASSSMVKEANVI